MLPVIIVPIVFAILIVGVFPLLLRLKPIKNIKYLDVDDESFLKLDDTLSKYFEAIKVTKNEDNTYSTMVIYPKENVNYADLTICLNGLLKPIIKGYRVKFKYGAENTIDFQTPVKQIAIYVNQINEGLKQTHIIQKINRKNAELFIGLEWASGVSVTSTALAHIINHSYLVQDFLHGGLGSFYLPLLVIVSIAIMIACYFILHILTFWFLGKYIYGGKFDA